MHDLQQQSLLTEENRAALFVIECCTFMTELSPNDIKALDPKDLRRAMHEVTFKQIAAAKEILHSQEQGMTKFYSHLLDLHRIPYGLGEKYRSIFEDILFRGAHPLDLGLHQAILNEAVQTNDFPFFIRLGEELGKEPCNVKEAYDRAAYLLTKYWTDTGLGHPPLCFFTDQALADFCAITLKRSSHQDNFSSIRKLRQRLRLKPSPNGFLFHVFGIREIKGKIVAQLSRKNRGKAR
jgi:hypothetical protein